LYFLFIIIYYNTIYLISRTAVLDGINLEVQFGDPSHFVDFVRELRRVMDGGVDVDIQKKFLITANPSCVHPSYMLGKSLENKKLFSLSGQNRQKKTV